MWPAGLQHPVDEAPVERLETLGGRAAVVGVHGTDERAGEPCVDVCVAVDARGGVDGPRSARRWDLALRPYSHPLRPPPQSTLQSNPLHLHQYMLGVYSTARERFTYSR